MGISLRRLGRGLRDGTAIPRFYNRLIVEGSLPAVAFDGQQFVLPAYGPDLYSSTTTGTVTVEPGKLYELSATGSGSITIALGTAASGTNILAAATYATARYFTPVSSTTHVTVTVTSGSLTDILIREVILGDMGTNLGASGYTMSVNGGTGTATESPTGQLNLTGDGPNPASADKELTGLTVGAHYRIVFLSATNAPAVFVGTSQGGTQTVPTTTPAVGVASLSFTATATTHWVRFQRSAASLCTITNITIAQWTPRPTLRTATFSEVFAYTASSTTARTYVGSDGLIKNDLSADQPRWDYSNGRARLLLENQSTNLILRSSEFDNASWTKTFLSVTANASVAPDGASTADNLVPDTSLNNHRATQSFTATATPYTISFYAKANGYNRISVYEAGATAAGALFQLSGSGSVLWSSSALSTAITAVGNGWYRCALTYNGTAATHTLMMLVVDSAWTSGNPAFYSYTGDGVSGVLLWGAQVESQSFASSYIPTTSATVTRLIETARFSPLVEAIASLPGVTMRVQATALSAKVSQRIIGATSTLPILRADGTTASTIGTGTGSLTATSILPGPFGAVVALNSSGQSLSANGGSATTTTTAANVRTQLYIARGGTVDSSNPYGDGRYNSFTLWPFRVANANLPALAVAPS